MIVSNSLYDFHEPQRGDMIASNSLYDFHEPRG